MSMATMSSQSHLAPERALHPLTTTQRIPSFRESGFAEIGVSPTPLEAQPRDVSYPNPQTLSEFHHYARTDRPTFTRLNTDHTQQQQQQQQYPMYTFAANRSPISPSMMSEISPATSINPNSQHLLPMSAAGSKRSASKKEPCPRPAAKRMRDTRDREGKTLKDLEDELEFEGRLGGAKRLNANNKDESGRRFSRADILEAEYESRRFHTGRNKYLLSVLHKVSTCTSPTGFEEIKKEVAALLAAESPMSAGPYPQQQQQHGAPRHYDSGYSETSDYERRSPSSGDWSAVEDAEYNNNAYKSYSRNSIRQ